MTFGFFAASLDFAALRSGLRALRSAPQLACDLSFQKRLYKRNACAQVSPCRDCRSSRSRDQKEAESPHKLIDLRGIFSDAVFHTSSRTNPAARPSAKASAIFCNLLRITQT